jgi:hypothetical protein
MSKTVAGFRPPHCLAPVAGGGGYLGGRPFPVNLQFRTFARKFRNPSRRGGSADPREQASLQDVRERLRSDPRAD